MRNKPETGTERDEAARLMRERDLAFLARLGNAVGALDAFLLPEDMADLHADLSLSTLDELNAIEAELDRLEGRARERPLKGTPQPKEKPNGGTAPGNGRD